MTDQDRLAAHEGPAEEPAARPAEPPARPGAAGTADPRAAGSHRYRPIRLTPPAPGQQVQPGWQQPGAPLPQQPGQPDWQQSSWQQAGPLLPQPLGAPEKAPPNGRWGWQQSVAGLLVGFAPEALLTFAAYVTGTATGGSPTEVSIGTGIVLVVSSLVFYGWQLFAAWLFSLRYAANTLLALGFRRPTLAYFWTVPLVLVASYAVIIVNDAILSPPQQDIVEAFPQTAGGIVLFTILAVVMAPLAEEAFFRGFVFRGFAASWGFLPGAAASAAIFSAAHLQLTLFVPLFVLGFGLAWAYHRTGSLWTNITIHAIFNGISVLAWALS